MLSASAKTIETQKGIIAKSRDYVHEKVATEEQLLNEKPFPEQIKERMPADASEAVKKMQETLHETVQDIKDKVNERMDEGTDRATANKDQGSKQTTTSGQSSLTKKIYEVTKSPEVKAREEFREKPFAEKLKAVAKDETKEGLTEILA